MSLRRATMNWYELTHNSRTIIQAGDTYKNESVKKEKDKEQEKKEDPYETQIFLL